MCVITTATNMMVTTITMIHFGSGHRSSGSDRPAKTFRPAEYNRLQKRATLKKLWWFLHRHVAFNSSIHWSRIRWSAVPVNSSVCSRTWQPIRHRPTLANEFVKKKENWLTNIQCAAKTAGRRSQTPLFKKPTRASPSRTKRQPIETAPLIGSP